MRSIWIETVGWLNTSESNARISYEEPKIPFQPLTYFDRGIGDYLSHNYFRFRVDTEAGIVKSITDCNSGESKDSIGYKRESLARITVGKRFQI